ncbi:hypothetical protein ACLMNJ_25240 [Streptomyces seoulensis]
MIFSYSNFTTQDLRGTSLEQLYTNVEADLWVADGNELIYNEVLFPVAELASEMLKWIDEADLERTDFALDSMSFAEKGAISITRKSGGWQIGSVFSPGMHSRVIDERSLRHEIGQFASLVQRDVTAVGIDPALLFENRGA